jgi:hypothetical protein
MKQNDESRIIPLGARTNSEKKRPGVRPITTERWDEQLGPRRSIASRLAGFKQSSDVGPEGSNSLRSTGPDRPCGFQSGWKWREE